MQKMHLKELREVDVPAPYGLIGAQRVARTYCAVGGGVGAIILSNVIGLVAKCTNQGSRLVKIFLIYLKCDSTHPSCLSVKDENFCWKF